MGSLPCGNVAWDRAVSHHLSQRGNPLSTDQRSPSPTIGVIGLGTIGHGIATNLHAAGFPLVLCDVRAEATDRHARYATVTTSPTELARASDVVVVAVVNDEQVHTVLSGPGRRAGSRGAGHHIRRGSARSPPPAEAIGAEAAAARCPGRRLRRERRALGGGLRQPGLHVRGRART